MRIELTKVQLDLILSLLREKGEKETADGIEREAQTIEPFDLREPAEVHIPDPNDLNKTLGIKSFNTGFSALAWCMDQFGTDQLGRFQMLRRITNHSDENTPS